ncbi:MAG: heavy-metal-associated domain-containing protein [Erysipelotrichaceae bacterium]
MKVFRLEGLDCAHCASKIEEKISKNEGVKSARLNFMTQKLTIESDLTDDQIKQIINEAINTVDENVCIR